MGLHLQTKTYREIIGIVLEFSLTLEITKLG
jgi:hypothetical protein